MLEAMKLELAVTNVGLLIIIYLPVCIEIDGAGIPVLVDKGQLALGACT